MEFNMNMQCTNRDSSFLYIPNLTSVKRGYLSEVRGVLGKAKFAIKLNNFELSLRRSSDNVSFRVIISDCGSSFCVYPASYDNSINKRTYEYTKIHKKTKNMTTF